MSSVVLDASVFLAVLKQETYAADLLGLFRGAVISSVNFGEVLSKAIDFNMPDSPRLLQLFAMHKRIEPFTESQARVAAGLRKTTRSAGLSLGDRACLALAIDLGADVYTADRQWALLTLPCPIHLIR